MNETETGLAAGLAAMVVLSAVAIGFAISGTAVAQAADELTFSAQDLADDGTVTVEDVSTSQPSTVVVTYTDGSEEVVAGVAPADQLAHEDVRVEIQDAGGFPGEHTAWVFDDEDLPDDLAVGDDATPVAGAALDSESAAVTQPANDELTFTDQGLADDGTVTVEDVRTSQQSTVVVTYTDGSEEVVAGVAGANNLDGEDVSVTVQDTGGFPGEHTAWVFDNADLPDDLGIGDDATPVAGSALDSASADVTQPAEGELSFTAQELADDGSVTVEDVSTGQASTVVVTYTDRNKEIVAGVAGANNLDSDDVSVTVQDTGGFPGEHTAWVFDDADLPADLGIGDDATPVAGAALDSESAQVSEPSEGELAFVNQNLGGDGTVTVEEVSTSQPSTVVVTYADGGEEVVAGVASADDLDSDNVGVAIQDAGGFPGEHTAWVFDDADLPADLGIGDDATPVAGAALDSESALVTEAAGSSDSGSSGSTAQAGAGELTFADQDLADDGTVTVEDVSTSQASTVVVTYTDGDEEVVAGVAPADTLDGEDVSVTVEDAGGFPGEHTAWVFDNADLPADLGIGDDATPVAGAALDSDSAQVSAAPEGELAFSDQDLADDGSVTVENVTTAQESTVVVTYTDGDEEVVAGVAGANSLDGEDVSVTVQDTGGFPGEHTAWVFDNADLPADLAVGDDATPVAGAALDSDSAQVTAPSEGGLRFADQNLADDGTVTVEDVTTAQESTVVVTYTDGDEEVVAGVAGANSLDGEDVSVTVEDAGGFPGEHTAWVFDNADLPADLGIGDDATPVADVALGSETASVTEAMSPDGESDGSGTDDGETTEDDSSEDEAADDGGPGFGIVVAVVAVVAGALVALKRRS